MKKICTTDSLEELMKSDLLSKEEKVTVAGQVMESIELMKPLRSMPRIEAGLNILEMVDETVKRHKAAPGTMVERIACAKGCSYCCSVPVTVTIPEMVVALDHADRHGVKIDMEKVRRQAFMQEDRWFMQPQADWSCVFLGDDGACRIYEARPSSCRKHFMEGDPTQCDMTKHKPGNMVRRWTAPMAEIVYSALMNVFRPGLLPKALLIVSMRQRDKEGLDKKELDIVQH